jgi:uncharacterized protein (DUF2147 family)
MKIVKIVIFFFFISVVYNANAQSVIGKWKSIDDKTGEAKAIVEIYENSGKVYGKIVEILEVDKKDKKCVKCTGSDKDKPILGLVVVKGLTKDGNTYEGGKIVDPKTGDLYKCILKLLTKDKLEVRGYIGISILGRSQIWTRIK